ncbi:hypothetical protein BU24DRAFT_420381 [Aaosphaeria arxii CBS 175.79]|uniref:GAR domain-containing protein n=1 Tax=Aaosphaeria arxii CBS 175.79 TaxID=1450172 RepID=A0A6A5XXH0_9PLEO|nr:uncharacterized protein BU24DRAFT_420381 [Aaosphaeria arxii CBS 175.79]KAF2017340.1 hypothetical protein BU24DRAFT_420381 [Aaosphaeria arxii CBS 175.79]
MSPGGRRGRALGSSEESHLRDLSPTATLRAFTERPMPHDVTRDEYKIFACIDNLTAAERDLGARVAKAAQRLKSWCQEIEQWGWSGNFDQPSEEFRESRRRSLELRIKEHVKDTEALEKIGPLEYWGSLLSVEVKAHEARLDEIGDDLLTLDIEELKEHVLDIHGPNRSRPSSAGFESSRQNYKPLDDFSFLITQTLLSALPDHFRLKERLNTWTARVSILREAPRYLDDLKTSQKAMQLAWDALDPPSDSSDAALEKWKEAVDTISVVLRQKIANLGQRLDGMLDTLEGREDCLPERWIDSFEATESGFGNWTHESRKRVIEFELQRVPRQNGADLFEKTLSKVHNPANQPDVSTARNSPPPILRPRVSGSVHINERKTSGFGSIAIVRTSPEPDRDEPLSSPEKSQQSTIASEEPLPSDDEFDFEDGDTVIHNELDESFVESPSIESNPQDPLSLSFSDSLSMAPIKEDTESESHSDRPQTPRLRRGSVDSISSDISFSSSPASVILDSPSVRKTTTRKIRNPKPELNAAMSKRRPLNSTKDSSINASVSPKTESAPWPPTQFSKQLASNSTEDLEQKISDILTTIPAHIRLTSGPGANAPEVKSTRRPLRSRGSKGLLRTARSINGLKSPELTLSPAKADSDSTYSGRRSASALRNDNDIKLYHLTQPGKEHPVKLFIRRVGENGERVMVRVGGGWADLGEYLRQYAEHHGRRTVSEGKFEILGLEVRPTESPRPESAMSKGRAMSRGSHVDSPSTTPKKIIGQGISKDDAPPPMPNLNTTPGGGIGEASAPSTGSSRHSWTGNEVGLAGPKAKKLDLSGEKLDWIEGMMKQARTVSGNNIPNMARSEETSGQQQQQQPQAPREAAGSRSDSRSGARKQHEFGDLGKFGGTKRVFLRGGKLSEH